MRTRRMQETFPLVISGSRDACDQLAVYLTNCWGGVTEFRVENLPFLDLSALPVVGVFSDPLSFYICVAGLVCARIERSEGLDAVRKQIRELRVETQALAQPLANS